MANVQTSIEIAAPPERVWALVTNLERLADWVSIHRDFPEPPPSEVTEGTRFQQTLAVAGTPFAVDWTALEVDGPARLAWAGTGPAGTTARTTYRLWAENGGTRFSYENEFKLPAGEVGEAMGGVVSGYAEREAHESLGRLKQLAEG
jgi:ligand-binding SRPBCC domain-containing protein